MCELGGHAVGIFCRVEPAVWIRKVATDVLERVDRYMREKLITGDLSRLEIREHQLPLVVEHLLEMRHAPLAVHGIAMEPAAEMIAHPAERHRAEGHEHHIARFARACSSMLAQQEQPP